MPSTAKFEARVDPDFKQELVLAAQLEGRSITDYVVEHLKPCIQKTLQREKILELNAQDSLKFAKALLIEEARPNPYLKGAFREHKKRI